MGIKARGCPLQVVFGEWTRLSIRMPVAGLQGDSGIICRVAVLEMTRTVPF